MTRILRVGHDPRAIEIAHETLSIGGLVVFPTDTVYGVGASVDRPDGVANLYVAKGRPLQRAIPVLVSGRDAIDRLTSTTDEISLTLIEHFWPGPLTVVFPAADWLPYEIVRDTGAVGLRMPDHPVALELIERCGGAVATTSANRSGEPEARTAEEALDVLGGNVDLILDGGRTPGGVPSTVVQVDETGHCRILRIGAISESRIEHVLGSSRISPE